MLELRLNSSVEGSKKIHMPSSKKIDVPIKRPRGRPPLCQNKKVATEQRVVNIKSPVLSSFTPSTQAIQIHSKQTLPTIPLQPSNSVFEQNKSAGTFKSSTSSQSLEISKLPQNQNNSSQHTSNNTSSIPRQLLPTQKILAKLMIDNPLTVANLMTILPEIPKDVIVSTLDILQVLGYVMKYKCKVGADTSTVYALKGMEKISISSELSNITSTTSAMLQHVSIVEARISLLQVSNCA